MFDSRTLLTFVGILAVGTAINPDNICVLVADGTKIVDDTNCAGFYTCNGGKATASDCPSGQYFNKDNRDCVPKAQATCVATNENPCQGIADGKFVAKPNSCSGYYYCQGQVASEGSCPDGLNFNQDLQACQFKTEQGCSAVGGGESGTIDDNPDLLCAYIPNGVYFGSAANCKTWIKCTNNIAKAGSCNEYYFNVQTQACVYENTYNCQQLNGDTSETGGTPPTTCTTAEEDQIKADPDSCSSYLRCTSQKYVTIKCPSGQFFDAELEKCTNRQDAKNDCDRCEGTSLKFVNAYQDGCVGYLRCENGKQVGKGQCDSGYYFNEMYGSCVKGTPPGFGVCTLPLPQCSKCDVYDAAILCGTDCQCTGGCPLQVCSQCSTYNEALKCGTECSCTPSCPLPDCAACCSDTANTCTGGEDCSPTKPVCCDETINTCVEADEIDCETDDEPCCDVFENACDATVDCTAAEPDACCGELANTCDAEVSCDLPPVDACCEENSCTDDEVCDENECNLV